MSVKTGDTFRKVSDHKFADGKHDLKLLAQYIDTSTGFKYSMYLKFDEFKEYQPLACANYIHQYFVERRRGRGNRPLNRWATDTIQCYQKMVYSNKQIGVPSDNVHNKTSNTYKTSNIGISSK